MVERKIRQPIVSILGHVDHGKTTLCDALRGTKVADREAGAITQHIGATEIPLEAIQKICGDLAGGKSFTVPGLFFIDTPGHHSFVTLRARGGSLADMAVLVVDVVEGFRPQTFESLHLLKRFKTPFVVVASKIDRIPGWIPHPETPFIQTLKGQRTDVAAALDAGIYQLVSDLYKEGYPADRYDRITDYRQNVAIVPVSAKRREGLADLLLLLIGIGQRFLEERLLTVDGPAEGTILEVKEERGLGKTLDLILYRGTLTKGASVVVGTRGEPAVGKVRALLQPRPLDEIRDPEEQFQSVRKVLATAGIKVSLTGAEAAVAGGPFLAAGTPEEIEKARARIRLETAVNIQTQEQGVIMKADALGSLEAMAYELDRAQVPVKSARLGEVSRRDIIDSATTQNPLYQALLAFNVGVLPDAEEELLKTPQVRLLRGDILYKILEEYKTWAEERTRVMEEDSRRQIVYPGKVLLLPDHTFRISKPAIVGVRVLAGRIRAGLPLLGGDGRAIGKIKSIRVEERPQDQAIAGAEVAIAVEGATVGRGFGEGDVLYIDVPETHVKELRKVSLTPEELEALDLVCSIHRKEAPFWGM